MNDLFYLNYTVKKHNHPKMANQIRIYVPYSDWKLYVLAKKHKLNYKELFARHNRKVCKEL